LEDAPLPEKTDVERRLAGASHALRVKNPEIEQTLYRINFMKKNSWPLLLVAFLFAISVVGSGPIAVESSWSLSSALVVWMILWTRFQSLLALPSRNDRRAWVLCVIRPIFAGVSIHSLVIILSQLIPETAHIAVFVLAIYIIGRDYQLSLRFQSLFSRGPLRYLLKRSSHSTPPLTGTSMLTFLPILGAMAWLSAYPAHVFLILPYLVAGAVIHMDGDTDSKLIQS
jgi:hypothetical protein